MAGRQKTFSPEVKQKIEDVLDNLPEKPKAERPVTTRELVAELKAKIRAAQAKGYTLEEIVEMFKKNGAQISLSTVKTALRTPRRPAKTAQTATDAAKPAQQTDGYPPHNEG